MTTRIAAAKNSAIAVTGTKRIRLLKNASMRYAMQFGRISSVDLVTINIYVENMGRLTYAFYLPRRAKRKFLSLFFLKFLFHLSLH